MSKLRGGLDIFWVQRVRFWVQRVRQKTFSVKPNREMEREKREEREREREFLELF